MVGRIFAEGKTAVCLYTDLRNPASNRCCTKLGFVPAWRFGFIFVLARSIWHLLTIDLQRQMWEAIAIGGPPAAIVHDVEVTRCGSLVDGRKPQAEDGVDLAGRVGLRRS